MKVLIVNVSDSRGGAAKAAYRLHVGLRKHNIDSKMLVMFKGSNDCNVLEINSSARRLMAKILAFLDTLPVRFYDAKSAFSSSWIPSGSVIKQINEINPDIVHLHWINSGMIKIEDLRKIRAALVWTLHDMWGFTGGCHYDNDCNAYIDHCACCNVLKSTEEKDLSFRIWNRKRKAYPGIKDITINCVSRWLAGCAEKSGLLRDKKILCIPNMIDTNVFKPVNRDACKKQWNIPFNKKIVLFGAMNGASDLRKGFKELCAALNLMTEENIELVVFGGGHSEHPDYLKFKTHYVKTLHNDESVAAILSAADVMVVPSLQENLSNAIMESLACETPVVCFNIGGNCDMVEHKINGYLAKPFDPEDLARGIKWVLHTPDYDELCSNAREKVLREFDNEVVAERYIELYKTILNK